MDARLRTASRLWVVLPGYWFAVLVASGAMATVVRGEEPRLWSTAYAIPKETTTEGSGYFSIVEGKNGKIYIGTAKYRHNAYLVEFDPATKAMQVVVDCHKEIGTTATGFAAQAKIHTRNNVGESGKIYFATKQGYPQEGELRTDYPGGYPMVYDPATGKTRVYDIPVPHHGIISITPDEARGVAYLSTCDDARPLESTHFMVLDLVTGKYRDLLDCHHMYAFIVIDHLGRAYHPILGGDIARYDPRTQTLERLKQTVDGRPLDPKDGTPAALLAHAESHPVNWEVSPDRKTLYSVAMNGNALFAYDLTTEGDTVSGRTLSPLVMGAKGTDCRAMSVAPDGTVWCGLAVARESGEPLLHVVSYPAKPEQPNAACIDYGAIAVKNPEFTTFNGADGKPLPWHHGYFKGPDGQLLPRYGLLGICGTQAGTVYATTLYPFTLHELQPGKK
jgi:hypothetical protein